MGAADAGLVEPPPKPASFTSTASNKPPVSAGGYNILPLVPAPRMQPQQPLEAPSIISPLPPAPAAPAAAAGLAPAAPAAAPGPVSPYEILTSSQMQLNSLPPLGASDALLYNSQTPQINSPYEQLTSSQGPYAANYGVSKGRVARHGGQYSQTEPSKQKLHGRRTSNRYKAAEKTSHGHNKDGEVIGKYLTKLGSGERQINSGNTFVSKDPLVHDLDMAMKIGTFKQVEQPISSKMLARSYAVSDKSVSVTPQNTGTRGVLLQTEERK